MTTRKVELTENSSLYLFIYHKSLKIGAFESQGEKKDETEN